MAPMRKAILSMACVLVAACGPSYTQTVKSPDDILNDQEALGAEQVQKSENNQPLEDSGPSESEQKEKFDARYTEMEISRAVRSAETCPGVVGEGPFGDATVSITFNNDGHVIDAKTVVNSPFAGTPMGECVLRAINAIITKNFVGPEETKEVKVKLDAAAAKKKTGTDADKKDADKKKKK
jgi:hypothetical protein